MAYGPDHLPYCSFAGSDGRPRVGVRIGDRVLDVGAATERRRPARAGLFASGDLSGLLAADADTWAAVRSDLQDWLDDAASVAGLDDLLHPLAEVTLRLPFPVADYVDFYASEHHATNIGRMFRPEQAPLTPNWRHLPIGYHGRAGTVVVSGTQVRRPRGQRRDADGSIGFGPTRRLDIEAEVGFVVGGATTLGDPVPLDRAADHLFGVCLVNDWTARDIQAWEYVPLGPFLGKSFATSISPWVTPFAALDAARIPPPARDPVPLPYLDDRASAAYGLDLTITVELSGVEISHPPYATMYWTPAQMLAHLTVNGASVRPGDLFASGTVSGPDRDQRGSLMELSWGGTEPVTLPDGTTRTFLEDGDEVLIRAAAPGPADEPVELGEVRGRVEPAGPAATR